MHVNRRLYPRLNADFRGEIHCQGQRFQVQVVNLSLGGVLVEGELLNLTAPASRGVLELNLYFELKETPIDTHCRVVYKRRLSFNRMVLGLHMVSPSRQTQTAIENYIQRHMKD